MKISVLRRNRRTRSYESIPYKIRFIFITAFLVCLCGTSSLAWALKTHNAPPESQTRTELSLAEETEDPDPYQGTIRPSSEGSSASSSNSSAARQTPPSSSDNVLNEVLSETNTAIMDSVEPSMQSDIDDHASGQTETVHDTLSQDTHNAAESTPSEPMSAPYEPVVEERRSHVIKHTAYQEIPVYRTVHHQASTAREVIVCGVTHIEWTRCPVCNELHDSPFNERIVDHTNEKLCASCGGKHTESYDEVVYY